LLSKNIFENLSKNGSIVDFRPLRICEDNGGFSTSLPLAYCNIALSVVVVVVVIVVGGGGGVVVVVVSFVAFRKYLLTLVGTTLNFVKVVPAFDELNVP
jgi:hypothetical protein